MDADIRQLVAIVDQAYDTKSWHGTNLRGSIRGLSAAAGSGATQHLGDRRARRILEIRRDAPILGGATRVVSTERVQLVHEAGREGERIRVARGRRVARIDPQGAAP
jgi:hypothetical protein